MKESFKGSVIRNSFWSFLAMLTTRIGGLIITILTARFLLPEKFGILNLALSIALIFLTLSELGINQTLIRYLSANIKNKKKNVSYFKYLFKLKLSLTLLSSLLLAVLAYPLAYFVFKQETLFVLLISLSFYILFLGLASFFESLFYVFQEVKYVFIKEVLSEFFNVLIIILIFLFFSEKIYLGGVIFASIITSLIVFTLMYLIARKLFSFLFRKSSNLNKNEKKAIIKFLSYTIIGTMSAIIFSYVDIVMLGLFVQPNYIGYYKAASALSFGILGLLSFVNVFTAVFSKLEEKKLNDAANKIFRYINIISIPAVFGILSLGNYFIVAIYGYDYLPGKWLLYILAPLIATELISGFIGAIFAARELPKYPSNLTVISTIMNVILNLVLISSLLAISQEWATAGAGIATFLSRIFYLVSIFILAKRKLKIKIKLRSLVKPIIASLFMSAAIILINNFIKVNIIIGILEILLGILIYFSVLYLIKGVEKEDIEAIMIIKEKAYAKKDAFFKRISYLQETSET